MACLVVVVFLQGRALRGMAAGSAEVLRETTIHTRAFRKTLKEHDDFVYKVVHANIGVIYDLFGQDHVRRLVGQNGITPFLGAPDSRIRQEIAAVAKNLQISEQDAAEYIRTQFPGAVKNDQH